MNDHDCDHDCDQETPSTPPLAQRRQARLAAYFLAALAIAVLDQCGGGHVASAFAQLVR
jgi:hypothetical protein